MTDRIRGVVVVGAGTMGHGIAYVAALAGFRVRMVDRDPAVLGRALDRIHQTLDQGVTRGKVTAQERELALTRVDTARDLDEAAEEGANLAIEAVPEQMELKAAVFRELEEVLPADAILASNTSSLSISELQERVGRPERLVGMHFFNPVHILPLVEVVRGQATSEDVTSAAVDFARALGKEPIVVHDSPGFASSRLGVTLGLEAIRMLEEGVASAEDIDKAMELGYRHPMGPLRLTDLVGLDVRLDIARYLHGKLGSDRFRPPALLERMVAEGKLGRKVGEGFYRWDTKS